MQIARRVTITALLAGTAAALLGAPLRADPGLEEGPSPCFDIDSTPCGTRTIMYCSAATITVPGVPFPVCTSPNGWETNVVPMSGPPFRWAD
jgi:hypothetical protein